MLRPVHPTRRLGHLPGSLVIALWSGKQVEGLVMVVCVTRVVIMVMVMMVANPAAPGRQAELTHLTVHLHLTQVGFQFPITQHLQQLGVVAHLRQGGDG